MADKKTAIDSIVTQWNGGEHRNAGARASELIYGKGSKPDEKVKAELIDRLPGIEGFLAPPKDRIVEDVPDTSEPSQRSDVTASNVSSERAKDEQDAVDDVLASGRKAREENGNTGSVGSTALNPPHSDEDPKAPKVKPKRPAHN